MIYTIGNTANYLSAMAESGGTITKTGRTTVSEQRLNWHQEHWHEVDYIGGYAFLTVTDAQQRIVEAYPERGFSVFGLLAEWDVDTYPNPDGGWWHNLLKDAEIICL